MATEGMHESPHETMPATAHLSTTQLVAFVESEHVPPFAQGADWHSSMSLSHNSSCQPGAQRQMKASIATAESVVESKHVAPLKQGEEMHSSMSSLQL